jgi:hypothetical protein
LKLIFKNLDCQLSDKNKIKQNKKPKNKKQEDRKIWQYYLQISARQEWALADQGWLLRWHCPVPPSHSLPVPRGI